MTAVKKNVGSAGRAGAMLNAAADLDLVKACLSCGLPVGAAVGAVADSGGSQFVDVWKGTANRLAMGWIPTSRGHCAPRMRCSAILLGVRVGVPARVPG